MPPSITDIIRYVKHIPKILDDVDLSWDSISDATTGLTAIWNAVDDVMDEVTHGSHGLVYIAAQLIAGAGTTLFDYVLEARNTIHHATWGLNPIYGILTNGTYGLSSIHSIITNATYGLNAIKGILTDATYGLEAIKNILLNGTSWLAQTMIADSWLGTFPSLSAGWTVSTGSTSSTGGHLSEQLLPLINTLIATLDTTFTIPTVNFTSTFASGFKWFGKVLDWIWNDAFKVMFEKVSDQYLELVKYSLQTSVIFLDKLLDALESWVTGFRDKYFFVAFTVSLDDFYRVMNALLDGIDINQQLGYTKLKLGLDLGSLPTPAPSFNIYLPNFLKRIAIVDAGQDYFGQTNILWWHIIGDLLRLILVILLGLVIKGNFPKVLRAVFKLRTLFKRRSYPEPYKVSRLQRRRYLNYQRKLRSLPQHTYNVV